MADQDEIEEELEIDINGVQNNMAETDISLDTSATPASNLHPQIVVTEAKLNLHGPASWIRPPKPQVFIIRMVTPLLRWVRLK